VRTGRSGGAVGGGAEVTGQTLVGRLGMVTTRVRGGPLPGEVRLVVQGIPHYYLAYCGRALAVGEQVLVINNRGARQLDVEPWQQSGPDDGLPLTT
jgi:membrane protein implicated in regulation of membrane protease activity